MFKRNVPFFEYPKLWSDDREKLLSIIDNVASTGGFILQKAKHPNKTIEEVIKFAENQGWTIKVNEKGHAWGRLFCPGGNRGDCIISVWSTPRVAENHAKQIKRRINSCEHKK